MADKCRPASEPEGRFCRSPRCIEKRRKQGQKNGRFLLEYWQDERSVFVMVVCPDCGARYHIEIVKS